MLTILTRPRTGNIFKFQRALSRFLSSGYEAMAPQVPTLKTATGLEIPVFGLGTWKADKGQVEQTVKDAIDVGYRHFDGAHFYQNESEVGAAIQSKIKEGVVKREDLFIVSKLWNTFHSTEKVVPTLKQTLKDLEMDYLDLYLVHFPMGMKEDTGELFPKDENGKDAYSAVDYLDTWKGMEEAYRQGLAKNIGISNFNRDQIERLLENCEIPPTVNQIECHPYLNQKKLIEYCKSKNILVVGYSPLGSGDRPWAKPGDPQLLEDPKIVEIAKKNEKSPAQVVLRWQIQHGLIVIPKTVKKERLIQNLDIFDFTLSSEDMEQIDSFDRNGRLLVLPWFKDHPHYPFSAEY